MPPSGYPPPNQGQIHQQQPGMGYYGQRGQGQPPQPPMTMPNQQVMMGSGSSGIPMNYQGAVPQMMQQPSVQPPPQPSMMQQALYGAQVAASRPYSGTGTNVPSGFTGSSAMPMGMGGIQTQGQQSYPGQSQQQQQQPQAQQQPQQSGAGFVGQQWQQSVSGPSQPNYAYSQGATASSVFSASSTSLPTGHSATATQAGNHPPTVKSETKKPLNPPPYSPQILDHLDKFSVGTLTVIGRELVSELTTRTHSLCVSLKAVSERKPPPAGDPKQLLEYCHLLMDKIVEIRLRVEKKVGKRRLNTAEYIKRMSDMTPPAENIPVDLLEKRQQFEENRMKLCTLNNDLKMLEWMASATDPSFLKKVDKMASYVRERE